jgi:hypothetical protein
LRRLNGWGGFSIRANPQGEPLWLVTDVFVSAGFSGLPIFGKNFGNGTYGTNRT